ncbi:DUF3105 domain-containing protein [Asanoa siamensis]|uniref:DUF3105 domain-containing protein n=1 Tax=Asanoa siamensis TaxID=926357 RepID=A0ABQ4CWS4_9ACTN|nr:DUF3105 domain-containing protein [Asanoa siamensis]GIF75737.1 hypothetical protein Asi02nite_52550 [Asanoa siamensis]
MSISTPAGDSSRQTAPPAAKKAVAGAGRPPAARGGARSGGGSGGSGGSGNRPGGKGRPGGGGPRKPIKPVKVSQGRSWGPIALFTAVGVIAAAIIGYGVYAVTVGPQTWQEKAENISGISDFRTSDPKLYDTRSHKSGTIQYAQMPPVAGDHNVSWQNCMGNVYDAQIANENAVHSLEHGAVWVTYRPDLPKDQVDALAGKVEGQEFTMMSPFPGLDKAISLQAWGYQLKVDNASDSRIDEFIRALRVNASQEPGVGCSGGVTATGTTPRELQQQPQGQ